MNKRKSAKEEHQEKVSAPGIVSMIHRINWLRKWDSIDRRSELYTKDDIYTVTFKSKMMAHCPWYATNNQT